MAEPPVPSPRPPPLHSLSTPAPAADSDDDDVVYVLRHSRPLPRIDTNRTVKQALLRPASLARLNRLLRAWRWWLSLAYWGGVALGTATLFSPPRVGVWLAVVSMPLQLVPSVVSVLVMRYDLARLVVRGYEFWYMTLSNVAVSALISFSFNDARFLVMVGASVAFETALLLDANHRSSRLVSVATVLGALTNVAYVGCAAFGVIEYGRDLELARYKHLVLDADDLTANLIATLVVLLVRNGVRKFSHTDEQRVTTCITYRCRVALVATTARRRRSSSSSSSSRVSMRESGGSPGPAKRQLIPLEYVSDGCTFRSTDVLLPFAVPRRVDAAAAALLPSALKAVAHISLVCWVFAVLATNATLVLITSAVAAVSAALVVVCYLSLAQRQLVRRLLWSFDFVFLSIQLSISHACLADMVGWSNPRALAVMASWLWIHWVLLLDAVLPLHKSGRLGFRASVARAVLVLFIVQQLLVGFAVIFLEDASDPRVDLRDNEIVTLSLHGRAKQLRVVPLLFGRMATTLSWSLRLLWRLWDRADNELLLLQGRVQYENTATFTSMASVQWPRAQIAPLAPRSHR